MLNWCSGHRSQQKHLQHLATDRALPNCLRIPQHKGNDAITTTRIPTTIPPTEPPISDPVKAPLVQHQPLINMFMRNH